MPPEKVQVPTDPNEAYRLGFQHGLDHKRSIVTLRDEEDVPVDFAGYMDDNEREMVAKIVGMPEWKNYMRPVLLRQKVLKHRQAALHIREPLMMQLMHNLGNFVNDLVVFLDNAEDPTVTKIEPIIDHGYNGLDDQW